MSAAADALDRHVRVALRTGQASAAPGSVRPLVEAALAVHDLSPVHLVPRQDFRADLRARLDAEGAELSPARRALAAGRREERRSATADGHRRHRAPSPTGTPSWRRRRPALVATAFAALIGLGAVTSVASAAALPGDLLYPFKRQVEDARLTLAGSDSARGTTTLDIAVERLEETQALVERGDRGDADDQVAELQTVLDDLGGSAVDGITLLLADYEDRDDPASLSQVTSFLAVGIPSMAALETVLPTPLQPVAAGLLVQWRDVETSVAGIVEQCGQTCVDLGITVPGASGGPADGGSDGASPSVSSSTDGSTVPGASSGPVPADPGATGGGGDPGLPAGPGATGGTGTGAGDGATGGGASGGGGVGVTLPGATAAVPLPSVGVSTGGVGVEVPLPSVTLPGATVSVPGVTVSVPVAPAPSPSTQRCLINALGICIPVP